MARTVKIKSLRTDEPPCCFSLPHEYEVKLAEFSPDSSKIAVVTKYDAPGCFFILDVIKKQKGDNAIISPKAFMFPCESITFVPGKEKVIVADQKSVKVVNISTGQAEHEIALDHFKYIRAYYLQGATTLLALLNNGIAKRVNLSTNEDLSDITYQSGSIGGNAGWGARMGNTSALSGNKMVIISDDNSVDAKTGDNSVGVYDATTGEKKIVVPTDLVKRASTVALSPDGKVLGFAHRTRYVSIVDAETAELKHTVPNKSSGSIVSITFSQDNRFMLVRPCWNGGPVTLYDVQTGESKFEFEGRMHTSGVFSTAGDYVVVSSCDLSKVMIVRRIIAQSAQSSQDSKCIIS